MDVLASRVLASVLVLGARVAFAAVGPAEGEVAYVQAEQVYLTLGRVDGARVGAHVEVRPREGGPVTLQLSHVAEHTAAAPMVAGGNALRPGDRAVLREGASEVGGATVALLRAPGVVPVTWQPEPSRTFARVDFRGTQTTRVYVRGTLAQANLRTGGWAYVDSSDRLYARERVDVLLHGVLDDAGHVLVDADLSAFSEPKRAADARYRTGERSWVELYRGTLGYQTGSGLAVDVGRTALGTLRYGLADGVAVRWQGESGTELRLLAGARPTTRRLAPTTTPQNRLFAGFELAGDVVPSWGRLRYGASGAWLGDDGAEAALQLGGSVSDALSLDAEIGALLWRAAPTDPAHETVDRAVVSSLWRPDRVTLVRLDARRLENVPLASELVGLPAGYLPSGASYQAGGAIDRGFVLPWSWPLRLGVDGGAAWDVDHAASRYWASPNLHLGLSAAGRTSLRLAYLMELGWMGGHRGEVGIETRLGEHLRLGVTQQAGVLRFDASRQQLVTAATDLRIGYELGAGITVGVRARGAYGEAGNGVEGYAWLGAQRWL
ncbi:MAG: hypothetical protein AAB426_09360 [Myxococcota bacterium]